MKGKDKCRILKDIRREIARNNNIEYVTSECKFNGECKGTCPKCEAELSYLEQELEKRVGLGKKVALAGITAVSLVSLSSITACNIPFIEKANTGYEELEGDIEIMTESEITEDTLEYAQELVGDIDLNSTNMSVMNKIISELERRGYTVECTGVDKEILNGERYRLVLNNNIDTQIVVYLYNNNDEAQKDSECIDESGYSFRFYNDDELTSIKVDWVSTPHFYLYENIIVEYVGVNEDIMSAIETVCGAYFAGGN